MADCWAFPVAPTSRDSLVFLLFFSRAVLFLGQLPHSLRHQLHQRIMYTTRLRLFPKQYQAVRPVLLCRIHRAEQIPPPVVQQRSSQGMSAVSLSAAHVFPQRAFMIFRCVFTPTLAHPAPNILRSEEHTSELQSQSNLVSPL